MNNKIENFTNEELIVILKQSSSLRQFIKKIGYKSTSDDVYDLIKKELIKRKIDITKFNFEKTTNRNINIQDIFIENSQVDQSTLRKYITNKNLLEYRCQICGLFPFWNNKDLTLTLDHINGNNKDNRLNNLRWVCPNCDRQLPTFGGRNQTKKIKNFCIDCGKEITKYASRCKSCSNKKFSYKKHQCQFKIDWPDLSVLLQMVKQTNYEEVARQLGVSSNAIRKHIKKYNKNIY